MTNTELAKAIREIVGCVDQVSRKRDGTVLVRRSYFYTGRQDADGYQAQLLAEMKSRGIHATVITNGDHWAAFKGGASIANQSHWYVVLTAEDKKIIARPTNPQGELR